MSKRGGGSLSPAMPRRAASALTFRMIIPGLPITAPDPLAVGLGGSETAGLQLAAELVRQGHRVTVIANVGASPFSWRGVRFVCGLSAAELAEPCDLLLVQRAPDYLRHRGGARAAFLWLHDQGGLLGDADRYLFVSEWQVEQFRATAPSLADRFIVIRNGIDLDLIADATAGVERDPYRIAYASRPERGLEVLLGDILPEILEQEPRASLHFATYDHPHPDMSAYPHHIHQLAAPFGDRVVVHDPLGKRDLYRLLAGCGLVLYPTPTLENSFFAETSCIAAMEAMACGAAWISTDRGALPETVGNAGVLVPLGAAPHAGVPEVTRRLIEEALRVMHDPAHAERLRAAGLARTACLGWAPVAERIVAAARAMAATPRLAAGTAPKRPPPATARPVVIIGTPAYGHQVTVPFTKSLLLTVTELRDRGVTTGWLPQAGLPLVHLARNLLAAQFLRQPDATHLMFIDADIEWQPGDVLSLLEHDVPLIAATYRVKSPEEAFPVCPLVGNAIAITKRLGVPRVEVERLPAGFMLIKREVFLRLIEAYPDTLISTFGSTSFSDEGYPVYDFFPSSLRRGELESEDWGFCRRWRETGGKVWLDPTIVLTHYGTVGFTGDPMSLFAPAEPAGEAA